MPDDAIKPSVDHLLILLNLDGSGQVSVLPEDFGVEQIADQEKSCRYPNCPIRQYAPAKTPIETRCDESGDKQEAAEFHDRLLLLLFLFGIQPLAKQFRILGHHYQAGAEHRHKENPHQQPCLPIMQRPCGQKQ